ncbi:MAG: AMP-binding protein, partial [Pseudomonadota bacterium]
MSNSVYQIFENTCRDCAANPMLQLVSDTAQQYGVAPKTFSYQEAADAIQHLIGAYRPLSLPVGARVALGLDNRPEFFFHWLALNALGISVVPLNPQWQTAELEYVLSHSESCLVVTLDERVQALKQVAVDIEVRSSEGEWLRHTAANIDLLPANLANECALLYTSGTTGKPKGCMLSNEYFISTGRWYLELGGYCALQPGQDRLITPLPMYHMNAMAVSTMAMLMTGSCIVPLDRFHPTTWWQSIRECDATIMHYLGVMPAMLMSLPPSEQDSSHNIRFGFGAGLSGELHTAFEKRFNMQLIEAWAMTETGCTVAVMANKEPRKVGTACFGRPPAHLDYRLMDDNGNDVSVGQTGELLVRRVGGNPRYGFFSGYLKDETATIEAWQGGYFHTGDLVYLDEDGLMHFVDRKKNVIRRSGENISAVEVEEILMEHEAVNTVGVTAVPDSVRGDEVFACIVTPSNPSKTLAESIVQHCLSRLAYFKAPGYVTFVEALPLTATGKIQRAEDREWRRSSRNRALAGRGPRRSKSLPY